MIVTTGALGRRLPLLGGILVIEGVVGSFLRWVGQLTSADGVIHYCLSSTLVAFGLWAVVPSSLRKGIAAGWGLVVGALIAVILFYAAGMVALFDKGLMPTEARPDYLGRLLTGLSIPVLLGASVCLRDNPENIRTKNWSRTSAVVTLAGVISPNLARGWDSFWRGHWAYMVYEMTPRFELSLVDTPLRLLLLLACILSVFPRPEKNAQQKAATRVATLLALWILVGLLRGSYVALWVQYELGKPSASFWWWEWTQATLMIAGAIATAVFLEVQDQQSKSDLKDISGGGVEG